MINIENLPNGTIVGIEFLDRQGIGEYVDNGSVEYIGGYFKGDRFRGQRYFDYGVYEVELMGIFEGSFYELEKYILSNAWLEEARKIGKNGFYFKNK